MPIISVAKEIVNRELGEKYSSEEPFSDLLFDYGLELDEVETDSKTGKVSYRVELPANRYDLLCAEGLMRSLLVFLGKIPQVPQFTLVEPEKRITLTVERSTKEVRPICVAAVLRDVTLDSKALASFIDLQDKLHLNLGRKRTLVAIGTHDLDTIQPPFVYRALPPKEIKFKPLNQVKEFTAEELMEFYKSDLALRSYLKIIEGKPVYPVIYDANNVVLSMPPIINGDHSKMSVNTKNIFIECTATDATKARIVLNTIVTLFSEYCSNKFTVEPVNVKYEESQDAGPLTFPQFNYRTESVSAIKANRFIGVEISVDKMTESLTKMCLTSKLREDGDTIDIVIPPTRADILHACDIYEDIAIAYGYNNIQKVSVSNFTILQKFPFTKYFSIYSKTCVLERKPRFCSCKN